MAKIAQTNKEIVEELFKKGHSAYSMSIKSGINLKECYHHIRLSEELKQRHKAKLHAERMSYANG